MEVLGKRSTQGLIKSHKFLCPFLILPPCLLIQIFSFCSNTEILTIFSQVCHFFLQYNQNQILWKQRTLILNSSNQLIECIKYRPNFPIHMSIKLEEKVQLLRKLTQLQSLSFERGCIIKNAIYLKTLIGLPVKKIRVCGEDTDFDTLKQFPLTSLSLTNCRGSDLVKLQGLNTMTHLSLDFFTVISSFPLLPNLTHFDLFSCKTNFNLLLLSLPSTLQSLSLRRVSGEGLENNSIDLSQFTQLTMFSFTGTHVIKCTGLKYLTELRELELLGVQICNSNDFNYLKKLQMLSLSQCKIADYSWFSTLKHHLNKLYLKELDINDNHVSFLMNDLNYSIQHLSLEYLTNITGYFLSSLYYLQSLKSFSLKNCPKLLPFTLKSMNGLSIEKFSFIFEDVNLWEFLTFFPSLPKLRDLNFFGGTFTDEWLNQLQHIPTLKTLRLDFCRELTSLGLTHCKKQFPNLEELRMYGTSIVNEDLEKMGLGHLVTR